MVTGIEAAGFALAIFPLVIEGLKSYSNGARTIKDMWRSQVTLKSLIRELKMEKCKFENTLTSLLEGAVLDQPNLNDPDGKVWSTEDFQNALMSRLRPDTVEVYIDAMEDLYSALQSLTRRFALGSEYEPDDQRALKTKWKMIRLALSKAEYKEQLNQISKINSDLQSLAGQTNVSDTSFSNTAIAQASASVKNYKHVRDHAMTLYGVLKEKLQPVAPFCQCSTPHHANLQLEMRDATFRQKRFGKNTPILFHVIISFEGAADAGTPLLRSWRNLKLQPLDNMEDQQTGKIDISRSGGARGPDFHPPVMSSSTLAAVEGNGRQRKSLSISNTKSEVGVNVFLQDDKMLSKRSSLPEPLNPIQRARASTKAPLRSSLQYLVWPLISSSPPGSTELISLRSLLDDGKMLGKEDRLILGVQLASTVLQLHKTAWLSEDWSNEDIFFHQIDTEGRIPDIKRPFVRQSPNPSSSLPQTQNIQQITKHTLIPHDQSLFSLGIVLMELWYGRPLEKLQEKEDELGSKDLTNFVTARRLASNISLDAGAKYGEAVRRCINGLDYGSGCLDADDLKRKAHMENPLYLYNSMSLTGPWS
ncbi:hypothetical protein DFP73DRAFT_302372 [Morchella snyderi]|nr:hypothetical protein DFP73DRAFT_302372 [Morchella snyderi]